MILINIQLDENYKIITNDSLNLALQELREVKNKETKEINQKWVTIGYYSHIQAALRGYLQKAIRSSNATSINMLIDDVDRIDKNIQEMKI